MLTETILQNASIDLLLDLMVERIHRQKALHAKFDSHDYKALKAEIKLLQQEIDKKKNQVGQGADQYHPGTYRRR